MTTTATTTTAISDWPLVIELTQQRHAAGDPVFGRFIRRQLDGQHKVRRVTGGRECAASLARLVDGRLVDLLLGNVVALHGNQPDL